MAIRTFDDNLNIISALPDEPTDVTPGELKAEFDKAGNAAQDYINDMLIPDINSEIVRVQGEITAAVAAAEINSGIIPTAGTTGQVIMKGSGDDYDFCWQDPSGTSAPTVNTVMKRGANGRAQVADPEDARDVTTKGYVDGQTVDPIGTIYQGLSNPWGAHGLLCNGARVYEAEYPELYPLVTADPTGTWKYSQLPYGSGLSLPGALKYVNGYMVVCGSFHNGTNTLPYIFYKASDSTVFIPQLIAPAINRYVYDIAFDGTNYIVVTEYGNSITLYYCSTLGGTWTPITIGVTSNLSYSAFTYANGYYALAYSDSLNTYAAKVAYSSTLISGTWAIVTLPSGTNSWPAYIGWDGTNWNIVGQTTTAYPFKYSSSNIGTGYVKSTGATPTGANLTAENGLMYVGGFWIFGNSAASKPTIYYSTDCITWTAYQLSGYNYGNITSLIYTGAYYMCITEGGYVGHCTTLTGTWVFRIIYTVAPHTAGSYSSCRMEFDGSDGLTITCRFNTTDLSALTLFKAVPTITNAPAYAYIKAAN